MQFTISRNELLKGLQVTAGVVERRQSMPVLANILLQCQEGQLSLTGSNLEMELTGKMSPLEIPELGAVTVSGKKLMDICRSLPEDSQISFQSDDQKATVKSGKSRFLLGTLPAADFPLAMIEEEGTAISLPEAHLFKLIETTHFAMADQDVRYYLNGLFVGLSKEAICAVAADGHRLAINRLPFEGVQSEIQFILPRKGALELLKLLDKDSEAMIEMRCAVNAIRLSSPDFVFVSRLIEGRFPDYNRVIPKNGDKIALLEKDALKQLLQRVSILTNEKHRAASLRFSPDLLSVSANNAEQEEVTDEQKIEYQGGEVEIVFNITYLLDVLNTLPDKQVKMIFSGEENSSVLLESEALPGAAYVIMPYTL